MKTLKRTLCLVLVLCMVVGVLAVGASAKFTDDDKINYKTAVDVMTGMGIIDGYDDGNFVPAGTLTREQGAKLIVYALITPGVSAQLPTGATKFTDVAATRWSSGVINYAVSKNIILGVGDNKFDPAGTLKGIQFAKMLLVALNVEGDFVSSEWATNTVIAANKIGLAAGVASFDYYGNITREQACQLLFNAINYSVGGGTVNYVVKTGSTIHFSGTDPVVALLYKQANSGSELFMETISTGSIGYDMYGLTKSTVTDEFGRTSTEYNNGKTGSAKVVYAAIPATAVLTYTTATTYGKIAKDLGSKGTADNYTLKPFNNSETAGSDVTANTGTSTVVGGQGTLVEVYATGTAKTYNVVVIDTFVKKLAKADVVAANKTTGAAAYITLEAGKTYETDAFKADDVVLYTKADGAVVNVVKAAYASGQVTATAAGSNYFRIDGEIVRLSANSGLTIGSGLLAANADTKTFYFDSYGNVIFVEAGETAAIETNYLYLIDTASKAAQTGTGGDLFDPVETSAAKAQAKVIDVKTGVIKVLNIGIVKGTNGKSYYATASGAASDVEVSNTKPLSVAGIYKYATLDDGSVVFVDGDTATAGINPVPTVASLGITKGNAVVTGTAGYLTSSTVVNLVEYSGNPISSASVTTYTGINNIPTGTYGPAVVAIDNSGFITNILVVKSKTTTVTTNYAVYKGAGEVDIQGNEYFEFYVGGEVKSYIVTATGTGTVPSDGDVVSLSVVNGKLADWNAVADETAKISALTVTAVQDDFILAKNASDVVYIIYFGTSYTVVDKGNSYATAELAVDDVISVYGSTALDGTTLKNAAFFVVA